MKTSINKTQAKEKIDNFFQKESFTSEEMRRIKRLAMKFNIKLGDKRKFFCKKCLSPLAGKLRVTKTHKTVECNFCGFKNRVRI